jgi:ribonuclease BN (tRNA processing enzyme)
LHRAEGYPNNFIRFLGTAGTRFIMLSQRRSSGGMWFSYGGCRGVIDPGPGSLVRICAADPPLSAIDVNTLINTHRHIDHCSDLNVLAEGMTLKSREKKGQILLTRDGLAEGEAVLMGYFAKRIKHIHFHGDGVRTELSERVTVESVLHEHHGVECYGLIFRCGDLPTWGLISDTAPLPDFPSRYAECETVVLNLTLALPTARLDHMSAPDAASLFQALRPRLALLTHLGGMVLDAGPEALAARLSTDRTRVVAASDGMIVDLEDIASL